MAVSTKAAPVTIHSATSFQQAGMLIRVTVPGVEECLAGLVDQCPFRDAPGSDTYTDQAISVQLWSGCPSWWR